MSSIATVEAMAPIAGRRASARVGLGFGEVAEAEKEAAEEEGGGEMGVASGEFGILMGAVPSSRKLLRSEGKRRTERAARIIC